MPKSVSFEDSSNSPRQRTSLKHSAKRNGKLSRRSRRPSRRARHAMKILPMVCLVVIAFIAVVTRNTEFQRRQLLSFRNGMFNSIKVKDWRRSVALACENAKSEEDMEEVKKLSRDFTTSMQEAENFFELNQKTEYWVQRCPFVFLDLGSGVGDSVGRFIDAGLEGCKRSDNDTQGFDSMHFDVDSRDFVEQLGSRLGSKNVDFTQWVKTRIDKFHTGLGPEDYCVYGVEANPLLKSDLQKLENHLNRLEPRPLRHLHFFTETAIHSQDNVTKTFYVDSIHNNDKYPGSTLFENNQDIRDAVDKFKDTITYNIDGMALSTLINRTMAFFRQDKSTDPVVFAGEANFNEKPYKKLDPMLSSHLIMYIDIEGSEFHVLNEAVDSGVLCKFVHNTTNQLDIYIQYHSPELMNIQSPSSKRFIEQVRPQLLACGGDNVHLEEKDKYFNDE